MVVHRCVERGVCAVGRWGGGRERDEKAESLRNQKVLRKQLLVHATPSLTSGVYS